MPRRKTESSTPTVTSPLLTRREAAAYLRMSEAWLKNLAHMGRGPRYLKAPGASLRGARTYYRIADLNEWLGEPVQSPAESRARDRDRVMPAA